MTIFEENKPDIILLDLLLPEMSGMDLIEAIRRKNDSVPIIITTTVEEISTIIESIDKNINSYIIKPINTYDLETKLNNIAENLGQKQFVQRRKAHYNQDKYKGQMEDEIRVDFLKLLKTSAGKGPLKVDVYLGSDFVEIIAKDSLTAFEKTIMENKNSLLIIEQGREIFYKIIKSRIEKIVTDRTCIKFKMENIKIDVYNKTDRLYLTVE